MGRLIVLATCLLGVAGCSSGTDGVWTTEDGFQRTVADPSVELGELPRRCFAGAHTIVVGPGPGCASLWVAGSVADPPPICPGPPPQIGSPVRIARRGELPVTVEVHEADGFHAPGEPASAGTYVTSGPSGECCPSAHPVGHAGTTTIPFDAYASDDTLEMIVATWNERALVRACAVELTEARAQYREACAVACEEDLACGWIDDVEPCLRACEADVGREPELCLQARMDLRRCAVEAETCDRIPEREVESSCAQLSVRREYECAY